MRYEAALFDMGRLLQDTEQQYPKIFRTACERKRVDYPLKQAALFNLIIGFFGGGQVSIGKPNPKIYFRAAQLAGIEASLCATFEDSGPSVYAANVSDTVTLQVTDLNSLDTNCLLWGI